MDSDVLKQMIQFAGDNKAFVYDWAVQQLVDAGFEASDCSLKKYEADSGPVVEELFHKDVCVLCARVSIGLNIAVKYVVYPNGRPEGYPSITCPDCTFE